MYGECPPTYPFAIDRESWDTSFFRQKEKVVTGTRLIFNVLLVLREKHVLIVIQRNIYVTPEMKIWYGQV